MLKRQLTNRGNHGSIYQRVMEVGGMIALMLVCLLKMGGGFMH